MRLLLTPSATYHEHLKNMSNQLAAIAVKLNDLPSNIANSLANTRTTPSVTAKMPLPIAFEPPLSGSGSRVVVPAQLDRANFPNVVHWDQGQYNSLRKGIKSEDQGGELLDVDNLTPGTSAGSSKRSGKKPSVTSCFMEDENGQAISESTRTAARDTAKRFWLKLYKNGTAPQTYSDADIDIKEEYIALMENAFPWLRYCENHWKAAQIWRANYTDWRGTTFRKAEKKTKVKVEKAVKDEAVMEGEVIDVDLDNNSHQDSQQESSKRPRVDGETSEPKRRRVEEDEPTPPGLRPVPTKITTGRPKVRPFIFPNYMLH